MMNNKMNTEEVVLQIPALGDEIIEICVTDATKYIADSKELEMIKSRCVEVSNNKDVSVLCLEF